MGNCQNLPDVLGKKSGALPKGPSQVIITTFTWPRDSHGLFDYESKSLSKKAFKAQGSGFLRRNGNEVTFIRNMAQFLKSGDQDLLQLTARQGNFWISPCEVEKPNGVKDQVATKNNLENEPWLVIKAFKNCNNKGYKLQEGELIKLGRAKFRIREIKGTASASTSNKKKEDEKIPVTEPDNDSYEDSFRKSTRSRKASSHLSLNHACRICLSDGCEPDDPFFSPCSCTGTMKLIHVKCLQTWLKSKLRVKKTENTTTISWKTLECELCKSPYPQYFEVADTRYDVVEIERPNSPYIILESVDKEKNIVKAVHVVKTDGKNSIRLGRGHDNEIRVSDISVSRCHAMIKLDKGNFYLEDNNSKFGTLLHFNKPVPIFGDYNNISVQVGRSIVILTAKKGRGILPSCFGPANSMNTLKEKDKVLENGLFGDFDPDHEENDQNMQPDQVGSLPVRYRAPADFAPINRPADLNQSHNESVDSVSDHDQGDLANELNNQNMQNNVLPVGSPAEENVGDEAEERSL